MRVLVTGATGFLGGHLVDRLLARGHRVTALARATSRTEELEARGVEVVRVDLARPAELAEPIRRAEALVHAAGGGIVRDVAGFYRGNTETTRRLLEVAAVHGALHRFVLVSSLAAHGPSAPGRPAREEDPDA
ncbi:MAG TPA: NAD-dependent epimerase/dehydratase family protein, partial [Polyangiaceae bacterium LLY-WYZ-15_(1-7)]|nr:NAD-dependent epimerase/dehydratase family protein [Polyangiaceae bacterium LLY-WYZ-15_(1-7)]